MFILSHCCQSPFPCWESHSTLPPWMPSNTVLVSGPAVGAAQILIWLYSCVFLPPMSTAIITSVFSFVGALSVLYTFHRHRVCLVDCVDLICSLYKWWECSGSSSLSTLALGFNCGFTSTSACGSLTGVCSWGCPGGCGSALVRARCGQVWMRYRGLGYRGSGSTRYSREFWAMVVRNIVLYKGMATSISQHTPYCLENPPDKEAWQATVHTVLKSWTWLKWPRWTLKYMNRCKTFFACGIPAPVRVEREGGAAVWFARTLVVPSVQGHRLPPPQELWPFQSLFSSLL